MNEYFCVFLFISLNYWYCFWVGVREQARTVIQQNKWQPCSSAISKPTLQSGFCRRELLLFGLSAPVLVVFPSSGELSQFTLW